jgi:hypothetical protein
MLENDDNNSFVDKQLYIGTPNEPTILFLGGFLDLILEARKDKMILSMKETLVY